MTRITIPALAAMLAGAAGAAGQQAPVAHAGMPAEAYLSPAVEAFVPTGVAVKFLDLSTGNPTAWQWRLDGASPATSTEQEPVVTYENTGTYDLSLTVSNDGGSSSDVRPVAVQAGGRLQVWNIAPDERDALQGIELGWFGNYAGTNWLGLDAFAEHYGAPLAPARVEGVAAYFAKVNCTSADAPVTVSLCLPDGQGNPGPSLASATIAAGELQGGSDGELVATVFDFGQPVAVDGEFFVTIGGFPAGDGDDIALQLCRRSEGEKSTTWHYALDDDGSGWNYLDTGAWYKSSDEALSLALCPIVDYDSAATNRPRGDANGDGRVDIDDLNAMVNVMLELSQPAAADAPFCDATGDGSIDIDDVNAIINIMLEVP